MIELVDSYKDFLTKYKFYRPEITEHKNVSFLGEPTQMLFDKHSIFPEYGYIHIYEPDNYADNLDTRINIWHLPKLFDNKILVDFGNNFNCSKNKFICLEKKISVGYHSSFRINLNKSSIKFVKKYIDKHINIEQLDNMPEYELVSVGKLGASLIKGNDKYILTPMGPKLIKTIEKNKVLKHFLDVDVEQLLNIELKNGWTEDKILQLTKDSILDLWNLDR